MRDINLCVGLVHNLVARDSVAPYNCKYIQLRNENRPETQFPSDNITNMAKYWFAPAEQDIHYSFPNTKVMGLWGEDHRKVVKEK
jgi:hypothetical protein